MSSVLDDDIHEPILKNYVMSGVGSYFILHAKRQIRLYLDKNEAPSAHIIVQFVLFF